MELVQPEKRQIRFLRPEAVNSTGFGLDADMKSTKAKRQEMLEMRERHQRQLLVEESHPLTRSNQIKIYITKNKLCYYRLIAYSAAPERDQQGKQSHTHHNVITSTQILAKPRSRHAANRTMIKYEQTATVRQQSTLPSYHEKNRPTLTLNRQHTLCDILLPRNNRRAFPWSECRMWWPGGGAVDWVAVVERH
jgi:hypothetical protein